MIWKSKFFLKDREGEVRTVRKFLLFPRRFDSKHWRWLEFALIKEEVCKVDVGGSMEWGNYAWRWCEIGFAAEPKRTPRHPLLMPKSRTVARFHGGELPGWDGTIEDLNRFLPKAQVKPEPLTIEERVELCQLFEGLLQTAEIEEWRCYTGDLVYSSKAPQVHIFIKAIQDILNFEGRS